MNDKDKRLRVQNLLKLWGADIICFQETKLDLVTKGMVRSLWGLQYLDWLYCGLNGASGGILLMWDTRVVEKIEDAMGNFSVSCKFKSVLTQHEWVFSRVYGPQTDRERMWMWGELAGLYSWWGSPWCIGGDFNVVKFPLERSGGHHISTAMQGFSDFISTLGLIDPLLEGGNITWSNNREVENRSHLDRFLFSHDWEDSFPSITKRRLPRLLSDHFPIMLECGQLQKCNRPFCFENMWFKAKGFMNHVRRWWDLYHFDSSPNYILANKLKASKLI